MPTILCLFVCFASALFGSEKEQALGKRLRNDLQREARPLAVGLDSEVKELGKLLAPEMSFEVLDVDRDQIIGLPGGFLVVPLKVLSRLKSRTELALGLAHAVGHIVLRHGVRSPRTDTEALIYIAPHLPMPPMSSLRAAQKQDDLEADRFAAELVKSRL